MKNDKILIGNYVIMTKKTHTHTHTHTGPKNFMTFDSLIQLHACYDTEWANCRDTRKPITTW